MHLVVEVHQNTDLVELMCFLSDRNLRWKSSASHGFMEEMRRMTSTTRKSIQDSFEALGAPLNIRHRKASLTSADSFHLTPPPEKKQRVRQRNKSKEAQYEVGSVYRKQAVRRPCMVCSNNVGAFQWSYLVTHARKHFKPLYSCSECGMEFQHNQTGISHIKAHHGMVGAKVLDHNTTATKVELDRFTLKCFPTSVTVDGISIPAEAFEKEDSTLPSTSQASTAVSPSPTSTPNSVAHSIQDDLFLTDSDSP